MHDRPIEIITKADLLDIANLESCVRSYDRSGMLIHYFLDDKSIVTVKLICVIRAKHSLQGFRLNLAFTDQLR